MDPLASAAPPETGKPPRGEERVLAHLGSGGLERVLADVFDPTRLVKLANACKLSYPGMRMQSQKREKILRDLVAKAMIDDAARTKIVRAVRKELAALAKDWESLGTEDRLRRLRGDGRTARGAGALGQVLFLATDCPRDAETERGLREAIEGIRLRDSRIHVESAQEIEKQAGLESESARRQLEWQTSQRDQLLSEMDEAGSFQLNLNEVLAGIEAQSSVAKESVRVLTMQLSETDLAEARNQATYWSTRLAVSERALADARTRKEERERDVEKFDARRGELTARLSEAETALAALDGEKDILREREGALQSQIEELRVLIDPAEKDLESAEQEEVRRQDGEANAQRSLASGERLLGQVQLELMRKQESLDNLQQKITDDFGLVMFDYAADVPGPVPLPFEGMVEELPVVTEISPDLESQLTQNRSRMRRMGPINPEAKQEFDAESERYSFMRAQVDDLRKAESDLRQVVAELDELTKQSFSKTFDAVDKQFRAMFTRLFGGGSARLALTDPDNLVETGIEIEARLPGRREQGLALLSGGERSLTAVALVCALLKVSPTPVQI